MATEAAWLNEKKWEKSRKQQKLLTVIGLLMEDVMRLLALSLVKAQSALEMVRLLCMNVTGRSPN